MFVALGRLPPRNEGYTAGKIKKAWCRRGESNPRPRDYETLALPLSYAGTKVMVILNAMESPGSVSRRSREQTHLWKEGI